MDPYTTPTMAGNDLSSLLAGLGGSDPTQRERAYAELLRLVSIFVRVRMGNRLRNHRESMDVCQSIAKSFVDDASKGQLTFDSPAALTAYLQRVVQTKLAELARHDAALKRGGGIGDAAALDAFGSAIAADNSPTASRQALHDEVSERILQALSEEERHLVTLRRRGIEWAEIARSLSINEATLRQRWSRLQKRIQELLHESR